MHELRKEFPQGIPPCGTDALRFTLASYLQQERAINMDVNRVVSYRHFCNKIWNAMKFTLRHTNMTSLPDVERLSGLALVEANMGLAERWILSRLVGFRRLGDLKYFSNRCFRHVLFNNATMGLLNFRLDQACLHCTIFSCTISVTHTWNFRKQDCTVRMVYHRISSIVRWLCCMQSWIFLCECSIRLCPT